eukprot:PITA_16584
MTDMLKKESEVKWTLDAKKSFHAVKFALSTAPILISLDYTSDFIIFSFASEHTLTVVLMQKKDKKNEQPIAFFNRTIRDVTTDLEGRRGKWITTMLEYDLEIKPTKLIKGQGLAKLMAKSNLHALDINLIATLSEEEEEEEEEEESQLQVSDMFTTSPWYSDIVYVLQHLNPPSEVPKDYVTKWIEAIPTRQATDYATIPFIESNILSRFGYLQKIITDNDVAFNSKRMVAFCAKYHIVLGHSTAYHPQGNGLVKSSKKSLINIIKKVLEVNKKNWHKKLINALWADIVNTKKSIGMSPFQLVYEVDIVFPSSLAVPIMKIQQEVDNETNDM